MTNKKNKKLNIAIIVLVAAAFCGLAVLLFVEGPGVITKQVRGLTLQQEELQVKVSWEEMECQGYKVSVTCEGKTTTEKAEGTEHLIDPIVPGKTYKVSVKALLENGYYSRGTSGTIVAAKVPQQLKVEIRDIASEEIKPEEALEPNTDADEIQYDGLKGDKFNIAAEGIGDVTFESDNAKIAKVSKRGTVTLLGAGVAKVRVTFDGDVNYDSATYEVRVNVYPDKLQPVQEATATNTSYTRAVINWDEVPLAQKYILLKKNAATGKYEEIATTDKCEIEITRDSGKYAVKAKAEVKGRVIKGEASEAVEVKGSIEEAESYSSAKVLKKLTRSDLKIVREIHGDGSTNVPQSLSLTNKHYVVSYVNQGGSAGKFISYNKDGKLAKINSAKGMGHANGSTYNPNTDKFYVAKTHKATRTAKCSTYKGKNKAFAGEITLPRVTSGIAYDVSNNKYYLSKGNEIYVCDSNFKVQKFIHKFVRYNHAQDVGAYNGAVFVCTWVNGNNSYIDIYRTSDGAYLGSYDVSIGEIESVVIDDGYLIILMNTIGTSKDFIYKTKERIVIK